MRLLACNCSDCLKTSTHLLAQRRWMGWLGLSPLQRGPQTYRAGLCTQSPLGSCAQHSWPDSRWVLSSARLNRQSLLRSSAYKENFSEDLLQASTGSSVSHHNSYNFADQVWQKTLTKLSVLPGEVHLWWLFPDDVSTYPCWTFSTQLTYCVPIYSRGGVHSSCNCRSVFRNFTGDGWRPAGTV